VIRLDTIDKYYKFITVLKEVKPSMYHILLKSDVLNVLKSLKEEDAKKVLAVIALLCKDDYREELLDMLPKSIKTSLNNSLK
jgi:hypothetical protein